MSSEIEYYQSIIRKIDEWLEEYDGDDEDLIDRKLDEQEQAINKLKMIRNAMVNSN